MIIRFDNDIDQEKAIDILFTLKEGYQGVPEGIVVSEMAIAVFRAAQLEFREVELSKESRARLNLLSALRK